jgi:hypothetical protein
MPEQFNVDAVEACHFFGDIVIQITTHDDKFRFTVPLSKAGDLLKRLKAEIRKADKPK